VEVAACAVGRIGPDGPWVGFAPGLDDGYLLVAGREGASRSASADDDDLLALASVYFEETLDSPPEELAATHADIGALVRHVAEHEGDEARRRLLAEAVDAIDDGLAADVVVVRLGRSLRVGEDPVVRLVRRVRELGV